MYQFKIKNVFSYQKNKNKMVAGNFNLFSFYLLNYLIRNFNNKIINHLASIYGSEGEEEDKVLFAPAPESPSATWCGTRI